MAKAKEIRKRIKSVSNTAKITRTMEMVATSKLKRAQDRVTASRPYLDKLNQVLDELKDAATPELVSKFPLLEQREVKRVLIFCLTADRGLCGGFNGGLIRRTRRLIAEQHEAGREVDLHVGGRKGVSFFRFQGVETAGTYIGLPGAPSFDDADKWAGIFEKAFLEGRVDKVMLVYAHFKSVLQQPPVVVDLLPIGAQALGGGEPEDSHATGDPGGSHSVMSPTAGKDEPRKEASGHLNNFIFTPSPEAILGALFPMYLRNMVYRMLIESVASELSARRVAMKNATDNASDVITTLTRKYNRARQAQITQEISEIVGGAAAIE